MAEYWETRARHTHKEYEHKERDQKKKKKISSRNDMDEYFLLIDRQIDNFYFLLVALQVLPIWLWEFSVCCRYRERDRLYFGDPYSILNSTPPFLSYIDCLGVLFSLKFVFQLCRHFEVNVIYVFIRLTIASDARIRKLAKGSLNIGTLDVGRVSHRRTGTVHTYYSVCKVCVCVCGVPINTASAVPHPVNVKRAT